jgi:hypothetical protein
MKDIKNLKDLKNQITILEANATQNYNDLHVQFYVLYDTFNDNIAVKKNLSIIGNITALFSTLFNSSYATNKEQEDTTNLNSSKNTSFILNNLDSIVSLSKNIYTYFQTKKK